LGGGFRLLGGLHLRDAAAERLHQVDDRRLGHEIVAPEPVAETPVIDLMEALRRSVADVQDRKAKTSENGKAASKGGSRSRKTPARKSA